ncbi:MAG: DUF2203 domain-containing protein [Candidatus Nitronauta litoralis]|uniref:DUF2203 domain-containing protein n=1 Tax=Candidatus Nitronauta litoralis TaxID=2705533 RepID=A0A7T0G1N5_9BACT|nr:MAG: DUF2203 domain-containing protein [Candidatus Nitronauta litoralis]
MNEKKYYTLEEANQFVPKLLEILPCMQRLHAAMSQDYPDVRNAWRQSKFNGGSMQGADYLEHVLRYQRLKKELDEMGADLKGVEQGLVDFLSIREGKEVYLCWKYPETKIEYWHDLDTGFSGRQPV